MQIACLVLPLLLLLRLLPLLLLPLDEVMHERDADADAAALSHYHVEQGFQGHSRAQRWLLALRKQLLLRHGLACFPRVLLTMCTHTRTTWSADQKKSLFAPLSGGATAKSTRSHSEQAHHELLQELKNGGRKAEAT